MEETKWLTKGKIIGISLIILVIVGIIIGIFIHKSNMKKEYIKFENQLKYAAPNYILKEKITLNENEWREIDIKDILSQKLVINKRSVDCSGYVIVESNSDNENDYSVYIKCNNLYTTKNYGIKPSDKKENNDKTQTEDDTIEPEIELFGDKEINLIVGDTYNELGAIATDNIDGDITSNIRISGKVDTKVAGTYELSYTVSDKAGNKVTTKRVVIVKENEEIEEKEPSVTPELTPAPAPTPSIDTTNPILMFNDDGLYQTICAGNKVDISVNGPYGYIARDNVDGNITNKVIITGDTDVINSVGTYSLYYKVSDNSGNTTYKTKNFAVKNCSSTIEKPSNVIYVSSLSLSPNNRIMTVGSTFKLTLTINPSNATDKSVTYSSSNTSVATIDSSGTVTAISTGTAKITATSSNGKKAVSNITVK